MLKFLVAALAFGFAVAAEAQVYPYPLHPDTRDQLTFDVSRKTAVENDEMTVVLSAVRTELEATAAADQVNEAMQAALARGRKAQAVDVRTGSYTTQEVYPQPPSTARPREPRWRVEQELILTSRDFDALRTLVTDLQSSLNLKSVGFGVSESRRIEKERAMKEAALGAFREDAERIRQALGFAGYEIVELRVSNATQDPFRRNSRVAMSTNSMQLESVAPVALEGGSSEVSGYVQARIQLLR